MMVPWFLDQCGAKVYNIVLFPWTYFTLPVAHCIFPGYSYIKISNKIKVLLFKGPGLIAVLWGIFIFKEIQVRIRKQSLSPDVSLL